MKTKKLKVGDILIAKDVCKMEDEPFQETLTVGKSYQIIGIYNDYFEIIDDEDKPHGFWYDDYDEIFFVDKIVEEVRTDLLERSQTGIEKYGTTLDRTDIDLEGWIKHLREELMDATLYLKRIEKELKKL